MVTLDDHSVFVGNGFSNEDLFQQVLYQAGGLDADKTHRLVVENMGTTSHLVIDSVSDGACPTVSFWGVCLLSCAVC